MNYENLHAIIERYENDFDFIYGQNGEMFKWRALKTWQDAFHSPESKGDFKEKFNAAKKAFSFFVDNSYEHPSTGIIKLWEKEPEKMEHLFLNVLLADSCEDALKAESNMMEFINEFEILRCKHFAGAGSYKVTPHCASVFMTLDNPSFNFIFRTGVARKMANYIGFEDNLGNGKRPNLANYYRMCDEIVSAMKEHENLFSKHASYLANDMIDDPGHHMMVFDLLHCSGYRGYYTGLVPTNIGKSKAKKAYKGPTPEELERMEQERLQQMMEIQQRIEELETSIEDFEEISLLGVEVTFPEYGVGKVTEQEINKITVQFPETKASFKLDKAYTKRPTFENDEEIVEAFTIYGHASEEIEKLKKKLKNLEEQ